MELSLHNLQNERMQALCKLIWAKNVLVLSRKCDYIFIRDCIGWSDLMASVRFFPKWTLSTDLIPFKNSKSAPTLPSGPIKDLMWSGKIVDVVVVVVRSQLSHIFTSEGFCWNE